MYTLNSHNGRIKFIMKPKDGRIVGTDTRLDSAEWMLRENKPFRSTEFPGYPVGVKVECGTEYFFEGDWPDEKPKRKRRTKDKVCGNDYCELE